MRRLAAEAAARRAGTAALLVVLCLYVSALWGDGFRLFPPPLDGWHQLFHRQLPARWIEALEPRLGRDADAVYRALAAYLLGLALPLAAVMIAKRGPADVGLGRPVRGSARLYAPWLAVAALLGLGLAAATEDPWGSTLYEAMELAAMVPEHFLLFGVLQAIALPGGRLGDGRRTQAVARAAAHDGAVARDASAQGHTVAVVLATALFAWIHVGTPVLELALSVPAGLLFAELTLRTQSIWPALAVHWTLNLVPMALMP